MEVAMEVAMEVGMEVGMESCHSPAAAQRGDNTSDLSSYVTDLCDTLWHVPWRVSAFALRVDCRCIVCRVPSLSLYAMVVY